MKRRITNLKTCKSRFTTKKKNRPITLPVKSIGGPPNILIYKVRVPYVDFNVSFSFIVSCHKRDDALWRETKCQNAAPMRKRNHLITRASFIQKTASII